MTDLLLLAVNLTRRCNLRCAHCYLDAGVRISGASDELDSEEVCHLLDQVADAGHQPMVVLTGGEPLVRRDIETIIAHGTARGMPMVVGTNGLLLTPERVASLKHAGLLGAGISVDSLVPERHDAFRGRSGAWQRTMDGIEACRRGDLDFQIHFSVTESNAGELDAMVDFARAAGARVLNIFFLVCTGRGETMTDISASRYEAVLNAIVDAQQRVPEIIVRARCAPHFKRIAYQRDPESTLNRISGQAGDGCIAATHYCRITPSGDVTACPYIPGAEGNVRAQPFDRIWEQGPGLQRLRTARLGGTCGRCEYQRLCGGCRARALASGDDLMGADPLCLHQPAGDAVIVPFRAAAPGTLRWSEGASQRLTHVPRMLRGLVRRRAEAYVSEQGEGVVTAEHLSRLAARRFGRQRPGRGPRR